MATAIIVTLIVLAFLWGTIFTLRRNAKTGMPSREVLERATQRARELEAQERAEEERTGPQSPGG